MAEPSTIDVHPDGRLTFEDRSFRCALGRGGIAPEGTKVEGDGTTPAGRFPLRRVHYRADRLDEPRTGLPTREIRRTDVWCDHPEHDTYNTLVEAPHDGVESLWRDDGLYDVVVEIGYNDDPPVPGEGSAVFLHLARYGYPSTDGCVALDKTDLLELLEALPPGVEIHIHET